MVFSSVFLCGCISIGGRVCGVYALRVSLSACNKYVYGYIYVYFGMLYVKACVNMCVSAYMSIMYVYVSSVWCVFHTCTW